MGQALAGHEARSGAVGQEWREADGADDPDDPSEDELAEGLLEAVEEALDELMASPRGVEHEHLAPEPWEVAVTLLGEPPDARDDWAWLAVDVRGVMLRRSGEVAGSC